MVIDSQDYTGPVLEEHPILGKIMVLPGVKAVTLTGRQRGDDLEWYIESATIVFQNGKSLWFCGGYDDQLIFELEETPGEPVDEDNASKRVYGSPFD